MAFGMPSGLPLKLTKNPPTGDPMMSTAQQIDHFEIAVDREPFRVEQPTLTGAELRALPKPPIGPDRDLYEEVPGPSDDILISDDQPIQMRNGLHFFSTPHTINPG
jgi:hypothetical protein